MGGGPGKNLLIAVAAGEVGRAQHGEGIQQCKIGSVHNRRQAARYIQDDIVLAKLFNEIGPRMKDRAGGYTRILKIGFRQGDAADMVILELVDYKLDVEGKKEKKESKPAKKDAEKAEAKKPAEKGKKKASAKKADAEPASSKSDE
jgi:large subunit ribosomal protein L17